MVDSKVPTFDALMWPALLAMRELGGSATHEELLEKLIELQGIPELLQNIMQTERQTKLSYNLAWAKSYLGKVGALENPSHGLWAITEKGKSFSESEVKQVPAEVRKQYRLEKDKKTKNDDDEIGDLEPRAKNWRDELVAVLTQMTSDAFERLAQRILRESGLVKVEVTGRSGDGGIDGVGVLRMALPHSRFTFSARSTKAAFHPERFATFVARWWGEPIKGYL